MGSRRPAGSSRLARRLEAAGCGPRAPGQGNGGRASSWTIVEVRQRHGFARVPQPLDFARRAHAQGVPNIADCGRIRSGLRPQTFYHFTPQAGRHQNCRRQQGGAGPEQMPPFGRTKLDRRGSPRASSAAGSTTRRELDGQLDAYHGRSWASGGQEEDGAAAAPAYTPWPVWAKTKRPRGGRGNPNRPSQIKSRMKRQDGA